MSVYLKIPVSAVAFIGIVTTVMTTNDIQTLISKNCTLKHQYLATKDWFVLEMEHYNSS